MRSAVSTAYQQPNVLRTTAHVVAAAEVEKKSYSSPPVMR